jgi:hypothetical protein
LEQNQIATIRLGSELRRNSTRSNRGNATHSFFQVRFFAFGAIQGIPECISGKSRNFSIINLDKESQGLYNASTYAGNLSAFVGKSNHKGLPFPFPGKPFSIGSPYITRAPFAVSSPENEWLAPTESGVHQPNHT